MGGWEMRQSNRSLILCGLTYDAPLAGVLARLSGLVGLAEVLRERHTHGRLHVRWKRITADRTAFQIAIGNQMGLAGRFLGVFSAKLLCCSYPDLCGVIDSGLSLFLCAPGKRVKRFLVFHASRCANPRSGARADHFKLHTTNRPPKA